MRWTGQTPQRRALANLMGSPVLAALQRRPMPAERLVPQLTGELLALQELAQGTAGERALLDLRDMLLIAIELARAGIGVEIVDGAAAGLVVLEGLRRQPEPWRLAGEPLQQLVDLQAAHDAQRRMGTEREVIAANLAAFARLGAGRPASPRPVPRP